MSGCPVVPLPIIVTALLIMHLLVIRYKHKLKGVGNDGFEDRLTSDFIVNGTDLLSHHLSTLFSLMSHCVASSFACQVVLNNVSDQVLRHVVLTQL